MEKINAIQQFFKLLYVKLFGINDTSQRIALGFGLGVFLGNFPGTGPIAALFLAWVLRLNRAAALLGALLTNTWISFITFILSVRIGSWIMKTSWQDISQDWSRFLKDFHWGHLLKLSVLKVIFPIIAGYVVVSMLIGFIAYFIILGIFTYKNRVIRRKYE
ncbi:MAG: DUF2062 domain-containing protein [Candidatus Omnitrophota bacterium]|nr:DUF2062 domain-containing protein [Candidatus Omnitrophota bacterium]